MTALRLEVSMGDVLPMEKGEARDDLSHDLKYQGCEAK